MSAGIPAGASGTWVEHVAACPTCLNAVRRAELGGPYPTLDALRNASQGRVWRALGLVLGLMEQRAGRKREIRRRHLAACRAEGARAQGRGANGRFIGRQRRLW